MARQSLPRFDLYGELGVEPSADTATIEAAYQALVDRQGGTDATRVRKAGRLRIAREWLTDPALRSRYDASRARAAARAELAAAAEAGGVAGGEAGAETVELPAAGGSEADDSAAQGPTPIPWPAKDLERPRAGIQWSSTPTDPADEAVPASRSRGRFPIGVLALGALAAVVLVGTLLFAVNLGIDIAARPTASPRASTGTGIATGTPTAGQPTGDDTSAAPPTGAPPTDTPTAPPPTTAPTSPPTSTPTPPAGVAALQQAAWNTIRDLGAAAEAGDLEAAQALLGDTAPGLRKSGLRRATFPEVQVGEITVQQEGATWVALAGDDQLNSTDGLSWTFDYGDRPLAAYRSPGAEPVHDLWWGESDGEHHLLLVVDVVTISTSGVTAQVKVTPDPNRFDNADYFRLAGLVVSFVQLDGVDVPVTDETVLIEGAPTLALDAPFDPTAEVDPQASDLVIGLTASNPRDLGGNPRLIDTAWTLAVR